MPCQDTAVGYGYVSRALHGLIFVVVSTQLLLGIFLHHVRHAWRGQAYFIHKSFGLIVLMTLATYFV